MVLDGADTDAAQDGAAKKIELKSRVSTSPPGLGAGCRELCRRKWACLRQRLAAYLVKRGASWPHRMGARPFACVCLCAWSCFRVCVASGQLQGQRAEGMMYRFRSLAAPSWMFLYAPQEAGAAGE